MVRSEENGVEASKRMHEYLLAKQRKQEEYWLRKYGKVIQPSPPSITKPPGAPRSLPSLGSQGALDGGMSGQSDGGMSREASNFGGIGPGPSLPPIPHRHQQPKGQAPMFHAKEPVQNFFSRNVPHMNARQQALVKEQYGAPLAALPPAQRRPPEPYRKGKAMPAHLPSLEQSAYQHNHGLAPEASSPQQGYLPSGAGPETSAMQMDAYGEPHLPSPPGNGSPMHLPPLAHGSETSPSRNGGPQHGANSFGTKRPLPPLSPEAAASAARAAAAAAAAGGSPHRSKPMRDLQLELTVLKAIKSRDDVLDRIRIAGEKLDANFGGVAPVVLSPVDPMVRLFYRLVQNLRQRTLEVVESVAVWRRKVSPDEPFIYYGVDYLANIGPDCAFLDALPFLRSRLMFTKAAEDPFLVEVTPDGIPIEEATTCDLRRGGHRFSPDALRIRMARKILAQYVDRPSGDLSGIAEAESSNFGTEAMSPGGGAGGGEPSEYSAAGMVPEASDLAMEGMLAEDSQGLPAPGHKAYQIMPDGTLAEKSEEEEDEEAAEAGEQARVRAMVPGTSDELMLASALEEQPTDQPSDAADSELEEDEDEERDDGRPQTDQGQGLEEQSLQQQQGAHQPEQQPVRSSMDFADDNAFIDFAIDAMVASLEQPHVSRIEPFTFTVAGWEIDQQLDEVVGALRTPQLHGATPQRGITPQQRGTTPQPHPPPLPRGTTPLSRPGSRQAVDAVAMVARPAAVHEPEVLHVVHDNSEDCEDAAGGSESPVHIHLRPHSRGLDLELTVDEAAAAGQGYTPGMGAIAESDEQGAMLQEPSGFAQEPAVEEQHQQAQEEEEEVRSPVHVHLRPHSRGLDLDLSIDEEAAQQHQPYAPAVETIVEAEESRLLANELATPEEGEQQVQEEEEEVRSPVHVHLRPHSRGLDLDLSIDEEAAQQQPYAPAVDTIVEGEESRMQMDESMAADQDEQLNPQEGQQQEEEEEVRSPVHVHLRPHSRGLDLNLSIDEEAAQQQQPYAPAVETIVEAEESQVQAFDAAAEDGEPPAELEPDEDAQEEEVQSPVHVHLRPHSRGLDLNLSIDEETAQQQPYAPAVDTIVEAEESRIQTDEAAADASEQQQPGLEEEEEEEVRSPVHMHLRPHSRGLDLNLSIDEEAADSSGLVPKMDAIAEAEDGTDADAGVQQQQGEEDLEPERSESPVASRPHSRGLESTPSIDDTKASAGPYVRVMAQLGEENSTGAAQQQAEGEEEAQSPVHVHLRPHSRGLDLELTVDDAAAAAGQAYTPAMDTITEGDGEEQGETTALVDEGAGDDVVNPDAQGGEEEPEEAQSPVHIHLRPHSRGLDLELTVDEGTGTGDGFVPSMDAIAEAEVEAEAEAGDQPAAEADAMQQQEEQQQEEPEPDEAQSPVHVHLRPHSRGLDLELTVDEAGEGAAYAPAMDAITEAEGEGQAAAEASTAGYDDEPLLPEPDEAQSPVRVHLRPHSRGLDLELTVDQIAAAGGAAQPSLEPLAEGEEAQESPFDGDGEVGGGRGLSVDLSSVEHPIQGSLLSRRNRASITRSRPGSALPSRPTSARPPMDGDAVAGAGAALQLMGEDSAAADADEVLMDDDE